MSECVCVSVCVCVCVEGGGGACADVLKGISIVVSAGGVGLQQQLYCSVSLCGRREVVSEASSFLMARLKHGSSLHTPSPLW